MRLKTIFHHSNILSMRVLSLLCPMLFALCTSVEAQQPKKVPRIGYLTPGSPSSAKENVEGFRKGLRELGYVEGKTIVIEYRYAEERADRLAALVCGLGP